MTVADMPFRNLYVHVNGNYSEKQREVKYHQIYHIFFRRNFAPKIHDDLNVNKAGVDKL